MTETGMNNMLDETAKLKWYQIIFGLKKQFGKKPDMNAILFLIGMNEIGVVKTYSKEEKLDLMHIATCKLLSYEGYYELEKLDKDGWPHYRLISKPPYADLLQQENLLKNLIIRYYDENNLFEDL